MIALFFGTKQRYLLYGIVSSVLVPIIFYRTCFQLTVLYTIAHLVVLNVPMPKTDLYGRNFPLLFRNLWDFQKVYLVSINRDKKWS